MNGSLAALRALRAQTSAPPMTERCDLCGTDVPDDHRHMIDVAERFILCVCEPCLAMKAGADDLRPTGTRVVWLDDFVLPEELWASFAIPVGLAFFLRSGSAGKVVALYPSPAGATECELELSDWDELVALNPSLASLEPDAEALLVNRIGAGDHVIAPIDECYKLVGMIKANWEGISGGDALERAIPAFFEGLR